MGRRIKHEPCNPFTFLKKLKMAIISELFNDGKTMTFRARLFHTFKQRILKPQMNRQEAWERMAVEIPEAARGGENSPVRFNIPREGIKLEDDHPPLPGFPKSTPQMIGSI